MKTIWDDAARREIHERLGRLEPGTPGRWGKMTVEQAVAHLSDALRMTLGELPCTPKKLPIRFPVIKQLIIYWLPFPKGAPTAPELVGRSPASIATEIAELRVLVDRIGRLPETVVLNPHPAFGTLSRQAWGVLVYRHMNHHLSQFGV